MLLNLDLLVVPAGSRLRFRQTAEFVGVTAIRIRTGHRLDKGIKLVKIRLRREDVPTLYAHVIPLIFQNLQEVEKALILITIQKEKRTRITTHLCFHCSATADTLLQVIFLPTVRSGRPSKPETQICLKKDSTHPVTRLLLNGCIFCSLAPW